MGQGIYFAMRDNKTMIGVLVGLIDCEARLLKHYKRSDNRQRIDNNCSQLTADKQLLQKTVWIFAVIILYLISGNF